MASDLTLPDTFCPACRSVGRTTRVAQHDGQPGHLRCARCSCVVGDRPRAGQAPSIWDEEDDMKIGGYGADGCSCAIQAGGCPVHHCQVCKEPIGDRPYATSPSGRIHQSCVRRGKACGQLVTEEELPPHLRRKVPFE